MSCGYPTTCVKCNGPVKPCLFEAVYVMGLGDAVCLNCQIRFSQSENKWKCIKPVGYWDDEIKIVNEMCCQWLNSDRTYECSNPKHLQNYKLSLDYHDGKVRTFCGREVVNYKENEC